MYCTHVARWVSLHVASRSSGLVEQNGSLLPAPGISATSLFEKHFISIPYSTSSRKYRSTLRKDGTLPVWSSHHALAMPGSAGTLYIDF